MKNVLEKSNEELLKRLLEINAEKRKIQQELNRRERKKRHQDQLDLFEEIGDFA